MPFRAAYRLVEPCIVAIVQKFHTTNQHMPNTWGSGFLFSEHGVVATCGHVVKKCLTLPKPPDYEGLPFAVRIWREVQVNGQVAWSPVDLDVINYSDTTFEGPRPSYVQGDAPDASFLLLSDRGTPHIQFAAEPVEQGEMLAFAGFPMGNRVIQGYGGLRQESSTLHWGIVAGIHPHRLAATPYGFLMHANTQHGASGSAVFRDDGTIAGMVYMGIPEIYVADEQNPQNTAYKVPTSLTGCISGLRMAEAGQKAHEEAATMTDRPFFEERMKNAIVHHPQPAEPIMEPYLPDPDEHANAR